MNNIEIIDFTELSVEQKRMVLEWRNSSEVRKWMYTKEEILFQDHIKFIESLKNSADKLYFLVKKEDEYIGVIDFTQIIRNESVHMGIYANPTLKGNGQTLLKAIIDYSFNILKVKKIFSEVFSENKKAYELYKKFNFVDTTIKKINNKEVKCLELYNENR